MRMHSTGALLGLILIGAATAAETAGVAPDEALRELIAGNHRYCGAALAHPHQTAQRRAAVAKAQHPVAAVLSCSDSRVPPEILFDQGIGDVFVVRTAGNTVDNAALGSLEYAAEHLGVRLILVLGHKRCGAVEATVAGGHAPGHIAVLVEAIRPAVEQAKTSPGPLLDNAVSANVALMVSKLTASPPILSNLAAHGNVRILGAVYDLDTGAVRLLDSHAGH